MKNIKRLIQYMVQPWQQNYMSKAQSLEDLERRMRHIELFEQHQALLRLRSRLVEL